MITDPGRLVALAFLTVMALAWYAAFWRGRSASQRAVGVAVSLASFAGTGVILFATNPL